MSSVIKEEVLGTILKKKEGVPYQHKSFAYASRLSKRNSTGMVFNRDQVSIKKKKKVPDSDQ